jgi:asparagine synthetase B (glutamine-hydrolysing)
MSGIAGIAQSGKQAQVNRMLDKLAHRGQAGRAVFEVDGVTLGQISSAGASLRGRKRSGTTGM